MKVRLPQKTVVVPNDFYVSYEETFYDSRTLLKAGLLYYECLPPKVDMLISCGHSGTAIASAMLMVAATHGRKLQHVAVHKSDEHGHSYNTLARKVHTRSRCAIVDDFISVGGTVLHIWNKLGSCGSWCQGTVKCILVGHNSNSSCLLDRDVPVICVEKFVQVEKAVQCVFPTSKSPLQSIGIQDYLA